MKKQGLDQKNQPLQPGKKCFPLLKATAPRHFFKKEYLARMPERVAALMEQLETLAPVAAIGGQDMPQGTIVTEAYYHDVLVPVELARTSKTAE
jgi:hypothetical protein